jgi:UDP-N-acetylglucosamine--N-acetylmuramyl-(pentapeptide) pyrophosphoryl-undecaprenol N-acetylglucosamine transferase
LQEQNSYAGITNKWLAKKASKICVAYRNMEKFFPKDKIVFTGNPVRNIVISDDLRKEGVKHFSLRPDLPVLIVVGGSLGAGTINEAMFENIGTIKTQKFQVLWQTGKYYYGRILEKLGDNIPGNIRIVDFITRMDLAYNVADLMVSRAGAISISEICLTGRAAVLVPSPNVAEDHQTKNAMALVEKKAAVMIRDSEAREKLIQKVINLFANPDLIKELSENAKKMAMPDSTKLIGDEVNNLIERKDEK